MDASKAYLMIRLMMDIDLFTDLASGVRLRSYQLAVANAVLKSIRSHHGDTIVVMFPRQSGKNELQAQLQAYLLSLYSLLEAEMVQISPTWKPQTQNAMRRLERVLKRNYHSILSWSKEGGYIYRVGKARIAFLSGSPTTNVVGATANLLLSCDEAQDVSAEKWDKDFAPMAASRNATRVFWGTAWTSRSLLARELRAARQREQDLAKQGVGRPLAFVLTSDDVRREVPEYGKFVDGQIARLGRNHPMVRTQFFSEEIDSQGGMFPASRIAMMKGSHPTLDAPRSGYAYALLLDVAGEDEAAQELESGVRDGERRDSTALTVVEVETASLADELIQAPTYRVVQRKEWVGVRHPLLYGQIKALAEHWAARYLVCDATGVGAGLVSFLDRALPGRVIPYLFTQKSKSDLGWAFLAVIETGRYKEYSNQRPGAGSVSAEMAVLQQVFWNQVEECQSQVLDGPGKIIRWGVPDGARDPITGRFIHDDLLISAALCSVLDRQAWGVARSGTVHVDPLKDLDEVY